MTQEEQYIENFNYSTEGDTEIAAIAEELAQLSNDLEASVNQFSIENTERRI